MTLAKLEGDCVPLSPLYPQGEVTQKGTLNVCVETPELSSWLCSEFQKLETPRTWDKDAKRYVYHPLNANLRRTNDTSVRELWSVSWFRLHSSLPEQWTSLLELCEIYMTVDRCHTSWVAVHKWMIAGSNGLALAPNKREGILSFPKHPRYATERTTKRADEEA
jgi:hypothetical protein